MTTLSPVVKNQWPLHPSVCCLHFGFIVSELTILQLKRVISVREAARAQGFPDSYVFESVNTEAGKVVTDVGPISNCIKVIDASVLAATETDRKCCRCTICPGSREGTTESLSEGLGKEGTGGQCIVVIYM